MAPRTQRKKKQRQAAARPAKRALHYKVVELSNVDEGALERTLNDWTPLGWTFDGVQFAMRESSKRPSMAFVFFTREGEALPEPIDEALDDRFRSDDEAEAHLRRLTVSTTVTTREDDAWARLQALAQGDDE